MTQPPSNPPAGQETRRPALAPWADDVALMGPEAPKNNGHIKHLICYLLTVYERFGDTAVTCSLQWGASALWKRDELSQRAEVAETELAAARAQLNIASGIIHGLTVKLDTAKAQLAEATVQRDNAISLLSEVYELLRSTGGLSCERRSPADVIYRRVNAFLKPKADHG